MALTEKVGIHTRTASTDHRTMWSWKRLFGKEETHPQPATNNVHTPEEATPRPGIGKRFSRKVVPGLPRTGTFKRQQSERRDRLEPTKPHDEERRTVSVDRRKGHRTSSSPVLADPRLSAPELLKPLDDILTAVDVSLGKDEHSSRRDMVDAKGQVAKDESILETQSASTDDVDEMILEELEKRWILNLSMHFRDKSKREKFFVTYAETPTHWRRVTISLDYRNAPEGSLEEELQRTRFQRDKSARIYEAIRDSLHDIQFYETVTNLKLQTENERLHVHVVEDLTEIVSYPSVRAISHLDCPRIKEDQLVFQSHLSGFVYKVKVAGQVWIKKEIPGPDTVDEFLYEINALNQLSGSRSVIEFGGVVLDAQEEFVKGLLISYAEQGALTDVIYDGEGRIPWHRRQRWARQIVQGLSEIHEGGFVQGDFTLSNIVIDGNDNAKIIDINRRGCPVGWEPPEVAALIESSQRISMYIGVKSDLYQLGMVLYALAMQQDEPEAHRPLSLRNFPVEIPNFFFNICQRCLHSNPRSRSQATTLLAMFPEDYDDKSQLYGEPSPIIVDVMPSNDDPFTIALHERDYPNNARSSRSHMLARDSMSRSRSLTMTSTSDQSDFPRRGRSPPPPRYETFPIPPQSRKCSDDYLGTSTGDTLAEEEPDRKAAIADFEMVEDPNLDAPASKLPIIETRGPEAHIQPNDYREKKIPQGSETASRVGSISLANTLTKSPSQDPLPSSTNTSYVSLPVTNHSTTSLHSLTPKKAIPSKSSQILKSILTERPQNILSVSSPAQSSLELKSPTTIGNNIPTAPTSFTTGVTVAEDHSPYSASHMHEYHSYSQSVRSHEETLTNTPFTPYTPEMGHEFAAGKERKGQCHDKLELFEANEGNDRTEEKTLRRREAFSGDLMGVGTKFLQGEESDSLDSGMGGKEPGSFGGNDQSLHLQQSGQVHGLEGLGITTSGSSDSGPHYTDILSRGNGIKELTIP